MLGFGLMFPNVEKSHFTFTYVDKVGAQQDQSVYIVYYCTYIYYILLQVSWVRHRDVSLISVGKYKYIKDARFQIVNDRHEEWVLVIKDVGLDDQGLYECQVNTSPLLRQAFYLHVVGKLVGLGGILYLSQTEYKEKLSMLIFFCFILQSRTQNSSVARTFSSTSILQ